MLEFLFIFAVCFAASTVGGICGIGGGDRAAEGDLAILPGHIPLMTTVQPGLCRILLPEGGEKAARLTLAEPEIIHTPGILEAPLTLECRVLYRQDQALPQIPESLRERFYGDAGDFHTAYIGQIVSSYILRT